MSSLQIPEHLTIKNIIHLWFADFHSQMNKIDEFSTYLSNDEIQRAHAFAFKYLRDQFIISRGFLRYVLATYLKINPKKISFMYSEYGKPKLHSAHSFQVNFNLSHSNEYFVIAISESCLIGVDVEHHNPSIDIFDIAKEVFSPFEINKLTSLPKEMARKEFFRMWTIKEAYIKAIGKGFSFDPKWIEINEEKNTFHVTDKYKQHKGYEGEDKDLTNEVFMDWYFLEHPLDLNYNLSLVCPYPKPNVIFHQVYCGKM